MHPLRPKVRLDPRNPRSKGPKILANDTNIPQSTELRLRPPLDRNPVEATKLRPTRIPSTTVTIDFPTVRKIAVAKAKRDLGADWVDHVGSSWASYDKCGYIHAWDTHCQLDQVPLGRSKRKGDYFTHRRNLYVHKQKFGTHWILAWRWEKNLLF